LVRVCHGAIGRLRTLFERIDSFHAGSNLAEHRILAVEEARVRIGDEELRVERVRVLRAGSADDAALEAFRIELSLDIRKLRTAHAGALQIEIRGVFLAEFDVAGLGHETLDDAVENDIVVYTALGQGHDALR